MRERERKEGAGSETEEEEEKITGGWEEGLGGSSCPDSGGTAWCPNEARCGQTPFQGLLAPPPTSRNLPTEPPQSPHSPLNLPIPPPPALNADPQAAAVWHLATGTR